MPNWVTHKLTLTASPDLLQAFVDRHLHHIFSQQATERVGPTDTTDRRVHQDTVPSTAVERVPVLAIMPDGTIKEEVRVSSGPVLSFESVIPLGDRDASVVWGTKWDASGGRMEGTPQSGSVTIWFDTPWSIPTPILAAIAAMYPSLTAEGHAFDELWTFAARIFINDGKSKVDEVSPSLELYRDAFGKEPNTIPDHSSYEDADEIGTAVRTKALALYRDLFGGDQPDGPLTAAVTAYLSESNCPFNRTYIEDGTEVRFEITVQMGDQNYTVHLDVDEGADALTVVFYSPFSLSLDRAVEMAIVSNWINSSFRVGRLAFQVTDEPQPLVWIAMINVESRELPQSKIETLVVAGYKLFEEYADILALVALTQTSADSAIQKWGGDVLGS